MSRYKAIIFDIDGTLVISGPKTIPAQKVINSVNKLKGNVHVAIATSRSLPFVTNLADLFSLKGPSIISGGAQIINFEDKKILYERAISPESTKSIIKLLNENNIYYYYHQDNNEYFCKDGQRVTKAIHLSTEFLEPELARKIKNMLSVITDIIIFQVPSWLIGKHILMITHYKATKEIAVTKLAKYLNINTSEIIGVGDGLNDIPLLNACGLKIAMGNAVPELKKIADYIAPSIYDNGVVDIIDKFL